MPISKLRQSLPRICKDLRDPRIVECNPHVDGVNLKMHEHVYVSQVRRLRTPVKDKRKQYIPRLFLINELDHEIV